MDGDYLFDLLEQVAAGSTSPATAKSLIRVGLGGAQAATFEAVKRRGYVEGWDLEQFTARQVCKLVEELAELAGGLRFVHGTPFWVVALEDAGRLARLAFDDRFYWDGAEVDDADCLMRELADVQVVVFCAAEAVAEAADVDFAVVPEAVTKALADVDRGVRGDFVQMVTPE